MPYRLTTADFVRWILTVYLVITVIWSRNTLVSCRTLELIITHNALLTYPQCPADLPRMPCWLTTADFVRSILTVNFIIAVIQGRHTLVSCRTLKLMITHNALLNYPQCPADLPQIDPDSRSRYHSNMRQEHTDLVWYIGNNDYPQCPADLPIMPCPLTTADFVRSILTVYLVITVIRGGHTLVSCCTLELTITHNALLTYP